MHESGGLRRPAGIHARTVRALFGIDSAFLVFYSAFFLVFVRRIATERTRPWLWVALVASHPQRELARRQMRGAGGMISVELDGGLAEARRFLKSASPVHAGREPGRGRIAGRAPGHHDPRVDPPTLARARHQRRRWCACRWAEHVRICGPISKAACAPPSGR